MLPNYYGKWQAVYRRFVRWRDKGIWSDLFEKSSKNSDLTEVMLDDTIVRSMLVHHGIKKIAMQNKLLGVQKVGLRRKSMRC